MMKVFAGRIQPRKVSSLPMLEVSYLIVRGVPLKDNSSHIGLNVVPRIPKGAPKCKMVLA